MRIVIALADDVLRNRGASRGEEDDAEGVRAAAVRLARLAQGNELVIVRSEGHRWSPPLAPEHNGDAMDGAAHDGLADMADMGEISGRSGKAGMTIGRRLESELRDSLHGVRPCETFFTSVEVDADDPAFDHPDTPVGAVFTGERALAAARANQWRIASDGVGYRRVVPSPRPVRLLPREPLRRLMGQGAVIVCALARIPVVAADDGSWRRVEAVVDHHAAAALVAEAVEADSFVIATHTAGVFLDGGTANSKLLRHGHPNALRELAGATGAMAPKLRAAAQFVERTGRRAAIGALTDIAGLVEGTAGTSISCERPDPRRFAGGAVAY
ncbi:MAG TPA: carbamate kinase [Trinickia sp.]